MTEKRAADIIEGLREDWVSSGRIACSYGAHAFTYHEHPWSTEQHFHVCTRCDARYFARGGGRCYQCVDTDPLQPTETAGEQDD